MASEKPTYRCVNQPVAMGLEVDITSTTNIGEVLDMLGDVERRPEARWTNPLARAAGAPHRITPRRGDGRPPARSRPPCP